MSTPVDSQYELPDLSVGHPSDEDPLRDYSWRELRDLIYGERERRTGRTRHATLADRARYCR